MENKPCQLCGMSFKPRTSRAKYCSSPCKYAGRKQETKARASAPGAVKICCKCKRSKTYSEYYGNRRSSDGAGSVCIACEQIRLRTLYLARREEIKKRTKEWRKAHPEAFKASRSKHYEANKAKMKARSLQWSRENKEAGATKQIRRRVRKKGNGGSHTTREWMDLCLLHGGQCLCCGTTAKPLTRDHVVPVEHGGSNNIDNIQPLCKSCNSTKGAKTIDYRPAREETQNAIPASN